MNLAGARRSTGPISRALGRSGGDDRNWKERSRKIILFLSGVAGWFGTPCANWASREADVLLSLGSRLTEAATSSWQPGISFDFAKTQLIQADIELAEMANVFPIDAALIGDLRIQFRILPPACNEAADHPNGNIVSKEPSCNGRRS